MSPKRTSMPVFRFSTQGLPEKDRLEIWREEFGRSHARVEFEPIPRVPFTSSAAIRVFPGLSILAMATDGFRFIRTRELIADGNDDLFLNIATRGSGYSAQLGREVATGEGAGILVSACDPGTAVFTKPVTYVSILLPRPAMRMLAADPEAALMKHIPSENEPLRLLRGYLAAFEAQMDSVLPLQVEHTFAGHVLDLAALAIGATRDGAEQAKGGLRAARLCAIKTDIMKHLDRSDLSVAFVAARQGISPRYVQMLFETEGSTFSTFVLTQRLARAHRRLVDPRFATHTISAIIRETGVRDASHFNRAFRRRYGAAPSDVRAEAFRSEKWQLRKAGDGGRRDARNRRDFRGEPPPKQQ